MTQSLGSYTFGTTPHNELMKVEYTRQGDVLEIKEALAGSVTQWNGTRARVYTLTGNLYTEGGTTYLDKMAALEGVQDDGKVAFIDDVSVHDASNTVYVFIAQLHFYPAVYGSTNFVPFVITLKEALD